MELVRSVALDGQPGSSQFNTSFSWSDLGITSTDSRGFRFQSTYITMSGSRYLESFENLTPNSQRGFGTVWFSDYNLYGVDPVPEPTNIALAIFGGLAVTGGLAARARRWWTERRSARA